MTGASHIITVVVPVNNREKLVLETLDSIASQTVRPALIVVDNNSTDATPGNIAEWANTHRSAQFPVTVLSQPLPGATNARNLGLENTTTPWLQFFDSDDIMLPTHIERLVETIKQNPAADIVGWDTLVQPLEGKTYRKQFAADNHLRRNIFNGIMSTQQYAATTRLFRESGGWNPELPAWNDFELGMRLLLKGPDIIYRRGEPTVVVRCQRNSITGTGYGASPEKWEKSLDSCQRIFEDAAKPALSACINVKRAVLAGLYLREGYSADSARLMNKVLSLEPGAFRRMLLRLACRYTAAGGRGAHYLFR